MSVQIGPQSFDRYSVETVISGTKIPLKTIV